MHKNMLLDLQHIFTVLTPSFCFLLQKFDKEPHYALLKELFTQVCMQEASSDFKYTFKGFFLCITSFPDAEDLTSAKHGHLFNFFRSSVQV